jgi:hypothetical protein
VDLWAKLKLVDMFAENKENTNNYFSALMEQDWQTEQLMTPQNSIKDAVRDVNVMVHLPSF